MEISHAEDITPRDTVSPIDDEELHQFTSDTKNWLDDTLEKLKWTEDYLLEVQTITAILCFANVHNIISLVLTIILLLFAD